VRGAPWWHASGGKEPPVAGRRRVQAQLGGRGAVVSSGEGGLGERSERSVRAAVLGG
jgi:hypothetical protein